MVEQPLIAGNWKMNKTVVEAEEFIQALLPRVSTADGVEVAICPPFTALTPMVDSTRGSRVQVFAQTMHQATRARSPARSLHAMLSELDVHGVILGHSERRELLRRDRQGAGAQGSGGAGREPDAAALRRRDRCRARERRHRAQAPPPDPGGLVEGLHASSSREVVIAYEPIWAIGTGKVAEPEQAQEAAAFIRALIGDRSPEQADSSSGSSTAAASSPRTRARCWRCPDVDGALVGGASLDAESFAAIIAAAG